MNPRETQGQGTWTPQWATWEAETSSVVWESVKEQLVSPAPLHTAGLLPDPIGEFSQRALNPRAPATRRVGVRQQTELWGCDRFESTPHPYSLMGHKTWLGHRDLSTWLRGQN
jgi:hypothetical protein